MSKPVLHIFAISHYCEKARWALDYRGIDYTLSTLAPGAHIKKARSLGFKRGALPMMETGEAVLQGSADIVSWAEEREARGPALSSAQNRSEALAIEKRLDEKIGIHVRRYFYSEALVNHSETVRPIFLRRQPLLENLKVRLGWSTIRKLMIKAMDLGPEQRLDSKAILETELDWLDGLLSDGRKVLLGDTFSRADLAAASLLAPLVDPDNHPEYADVVLPPAIAEDVKGWAVRPSLNYVRDIYRQYRA
ncbi:MAG: glutathione S-transferase N-terminal domain-containing protein [Pseudomonadota bacterium]